MAVWYTCTKQMLCSATAELSGYVAGAPAAWRQSNGPARLPIVNSPALTRDAVYSWRASSVPDRPWPKETTYARGREAHKLDVVPRQHPADAVEYRPDIRQESD
jgi:hypothetical protein